MAGRDFKDIPEELRARALAEQARLQKLGFPIAETRAERARLAAEIARVQARQAAPAPVAQAQPAPVQQVRPAQVQQPAPVQQRAAQRQAEARQRQIQEQQVAVERRAQEQRAAEQQRAQEQRATEQRQRAQEQARAQAEAVRQAEAQPRLQEPQRPVAPPSLAQAVTPAQQAALAAQRRLEQQERLREQQAVTAPQVYNIEAEAEAERVRQAELEASLLLAQQMQAEADRQAAESEASLRLAQELGAEEAQGVEVEDDPAHQAFLAQFAAEDQAARARAAQPPAAVQLIDNGGPIDNFLNNIAQRYTAALNVNDGPNLLWGGDIEAIAFGMMNNYTVVVHETNAGLLTGVVRRLGPENGRELHLLFNGGHFDVCDNRGMLTLGIASAGNCQFSAFLAAQRQLNGEPLRQSTPQETQVLRTAIANYLLINFSEDIRVRFLGVIREIDRNLPEALARLPRSALRDEAVALRQARIANPSQNNMEDLALQQAIEASRIDAPRVEVVRPASPAEATRSEAARQAEAAEAARQAEAVQLEADERLAREWQERYDIGGDNIDIGGAQAASPRQAAPVPLLSAQQIFDLARSQAPLTPEQLASVRLTLVSSPNSVIRAGLLSQVDRGGYATLMWAAFRGHNDLIRVISGACTAPERVALLGQVNAAGLNNFSEVISGLSRANYDTFSALLDGLTREDVQDIINAPISRGVSLIDTPAANRLGIVPLLERYGARSGATRVPNNPNTSILPAFNARAVPPSRVLTFAQRLEALVGFDMDTIPEEFNCSLSYQVMDDPVYNLTIVSENRTHYDRIAIERHIRSSEEGQRRYVELAGIMSRRAMREEEYQEYEELSSYRDGPRDPVTREPLTRDQLRPDDALKRRIEAFVREQEGFFNAARAGVAPEAVTRQEATRQAAAPAQIETDERMARELDEQWNQQRNPRVENDIGDLMMRGFASRLGWQQAAAPQQAVPIPLLTGPQILELARSREPLTPGQIASVRHTLASSVDRVRFLSHPDLNADTILHWAAYNGHNELIRVISGACTAQERIALLGRENVEGYNVFLEAARSERSRASHDTFVALLDGLAREAVQNLINRRNNNISVIDTPLAARLNIVPLLERYGAVARRRNENLDIIREGQNYNRVNRAAERAAADLQNYYRPINEDAVLGRAREWFYRPNASHNTNVIMSDGSTQRQDILPIARRAFDDIMNRNEWPPRRYAPNDNPGLDTRRILAYIWTGINDRNAMQNPAMVFNERDIEDRRNALILTLTECQRNYNRTTNTPIGLGDDGGPDHPSCAHGHFNRIVSNLDGTHHLVNLPTFTRDGLNDRGMFCAIEAFRRLDQPARQQYHETFEADGDMSSLLAYIIDSIRPQLEDEFRDHFPPADINAVLDNLEYRLDAIVASAPPSDPSAPGVSNRSPRP